ncbi:SPRY-domain-containing protein [Linnemannia elongata AG-77]|uniref:SPRY-domain-containing protein n=1 Tax=Linnemannia elongata AG-77 TaxID=1314771 RepID=A0A197K0Z5_9FUNG|nr:SPRY-domain-containing protein [Linnemannia elongata AG-77]
MFLFYFDKIADFKNDMTVSASVTANHPINPKVGVFYFEITIDHFKGNSALSIGIASKSLRKNFQVGWDLNSWGFHSDDGFLYFGNGKQNLKYSYEYREGDTVGCGVNFLDKAVFFTINGEMMGIAFRFIKDSIPLYPAIGLSQAGTEINANFGDQTFLFNIVDYKKSIMAKAIHTQPVMTWNNGAKNEKVFQILADGLSVIASGKDTGCIRGPKVSPRDKDVFYFEIAILYMPPSDLGTITVGVCGKEQSLTDVLGWKPGSYGYSSECGDFLSVSSNRSSLHARSQSGLMKARARGPPFRTGSVVGCGVDFASRELFFTLNGECLGHAFHDLDVLDCFPCVSVIDGGGGGVGGPLSTLAANGGGGIGVAKPKSSGVNSADRGGFEFKANFGQYPFMFDLAAFESNGGQ